MKVRAQGYDRGWLPSWRPPVPCISVGNINWGGSGKTPLCSWLLTWCERLGLQSAVLTRGYRANPPHLPYYVHPESAVASAGDEPLMLAREHPEAWVVVDPNRKRAGQWAWQEIRPDVYILDDGFQHLAVQRDINLLLFRPEDLSQNWNRVIPSGPWREGANALRRASALLFHADPERGHAMAQTVQDRIPQLGVPMFSYSYHTRGVCKIFDHSPVEPSATYILVSAVGNPSGVEFSARQVFFDPPLDHMQFPDHHPYTSQDWSIISQRATECKARYIVCTPKDKVKLEAVADSRLCVLDVCLDIAGEIGQDHEFGQWLQDEMHKGKARHRTG